MIYFITDDIYTKIGYSKNPIRRIKDLQTSNPRELKFSYIFDVKNSYEKIIHKILKQYKTKANNEWFDLNNINLDKECFEKISNPNFRDSKLAKFKAVKLNNEFYRGVNYSKDSKENILKELHTNKNKELQNKRKELLNDIRSHLDNKKNKRISYDIYIKNYGFTKKEISYFVKSAKLSNKVYNHNKNI